jgi:hypothetical protein
MEELKQKGGARFKEELKGWEFTLEGMKMKISSVMFWEVLECSTGMDKKNLSS